MNSGKFIGLLQKYYKQLLFEQDIPPAPAAAAAPLPPPPPAPPVGPGETATDIERPQKVEGPISQETESFIIDLIAKSIFIDIEDEEKYKIKNMQQNLSDETVNDVELQLLKRIKAENYKILDIDETLFNLTPEQSRKFLNRLIEHDIIKDQEIPSGGGEVYLVNLLITVLLRDFNLEDKVKVEELLEEIKKEKELKTEKFFKAQFAKYV